MTNDFFLELRFAAVKINELHPRCRGFEGILAGKLTSLFESDRWDTVETENIDFTGFKWICL